MSNVNDALAGSSVPLNISSAVGAPGGAPLIAYTTPLSDSVARDAGTPKSLHPTTAIAKIAATKPAETHRAANRSVSHM